MAEIRYNKSIVKNINENMIRKCIHNMDSFTKTAITRDTGLSFPTVSRIIDELTRRGELMTVGVDASTGGRHALAYTINPEHAYILVLYITMGKLKVLLVNAIGEVTSVETLPMEGESKFVELLDGVIRKAKRGKPIRAISIGLPWGISQGKIEFGAHKSGLKGYKLQEHLEKKFKIPARVENDMNLIATGCYLRMYAGEIASLACLNIGNTGCGCGLYIRGHLIRGAHGFAGELRYLPMNEDANMDKAVFSEKNAEKRQAAIVQMVASLYAVVDPSCIVLYRSGNISLDVEAVEEECRKYLPKEVEPRLIESNRGLEDFERGLIYFGREMLLAGYEIVNR